MANQEAMEERKKIKRPKRNKGPRTVIVDEPIKFNGDPLQLNPKEEMVYPDLDVNEKALNRNDVVVERYNPDVESGLLYPEVEARLMAGFVNDTSTGSSKTIRNIIYKNIFTFFNLLNIAIAIWLLTAEASILNYNFLVIIVANVVIGIFQEVKAKKTIDNLSLLSAPTAFVIRDSNEVEININAIVIDDILRLNTGKQISADAVVRSGVIEVDESLLTGESKLVTKKKGDPLFSGSFVVSGTAHAQVVAVGDDIYVQQLTEKAKKYKQPKSELFTSLKRIIKTIGVIIIPIAITLYFIMSKDASMTYQEKVLSATGAMIGMIPSGLFLLTSTSLAVGVIRLAQNNTLVQELYCIELLARVDMLCLDKTGTITDGTMTVNNVIEYEQVKGLNFKDTVSAILNAQKESNLTSQSLEEHFGKEHKLKEIDVIPFSSERKFSAVTFEKYGTFVLGAPEFIIKKTGNIRFFDEVDRQSRLGFRVLVVGHSPEEISAQKIRGNVVPVGLIMIEDTIRPDAIETIQYFKDYGVNIKVISGDNAATVSNIAERANIEDAHKFVSLEGMSDSEVIAVAKDYVVFGRVSPHQKQVLVKALKEVGHTVAMTGDGVNDILALREADTSIAMASGSEAARNVAHLVLLDSNFSSMPKVVAEGRRVINNIEKLASLFLTKTMFTVLLSIVAILKGGYYPISPVQQIPINILIIGIPTFFLAMESNNNRVEGNFLSNVVKGSLPAALVIVINTLIIYGLVETLNMNLAVTSTLVVLTATVTMFVSLLKISTPFNVLRFLIFSIMATFFLTLTFTSPQVFDLVPLGDLSISQILLLIVLVQASYPLVYILSNITRWVKEIFNNIMATLNNL